MSQAAKELQQDGIQIKKNSKKKNFRKDSKKIQSQNRKKIQKKFLVQLKENYGFGGLGLCRWIRNEKIKNLKKNCRGFPYKRN